MYALAEIAKSLKSIWQMLGYWLRVEGYGGKMEGDANIDPWNGTSIHVT